MKIEPILRDLSASLICEEFQNTLKDVKSKKIFLLLGKTGAGKSTITNYLLGRGMILKKNKTTNKLIVRLCDITLSYANSTSDYEQKLNVWKSDCNKKNLPVPNILFIFHPEKKWKASLNDLPHNIYEEKSIDPNSLFGKELQKITSKNVNIYNENVLYDLLKKEILFDNYNEQTTASGLQLALTSASGKSCTKRPTLYFDIADCPGSEDTNGFTERLNAHLCVRALIQNAQEVQGIIAVVDWDDSTTTRYPSFQQLGAFFARFLQPNANIPILFLINKFITSLDDDPNSFIVQRVTDFVQERFDETKDDYIKLMKPNPDDVEKKEQDALNDKLNIFDRMIQHPENITLVDVRNDTARTEIENWKKSISENPVKNRNKRNMFRFDNDPDVIAFKNALDDEIEKWNACLQNYKDERIIIQSKRQILNLKKENGQNRNQLVTEWNSKLASANNKTKDYVVKQIEKYYEEEIDKISNENQKKDSLKDHFQLEKKRLQEELALLEEDNNLVKVHSLHISAKNDQNWFVNLFYGDIKIPIKHVSEEQGFEVVCVDESGSSNLRNDKLKILSREKIGENIFSSYSGIYTISPGEEVTGNILFSVTNKNYIPTQNMIKTKIEQVKKYEWEIDKLNTVISEAIVKKKNLESEFEQKKIAIDANKEDLEKTIMELKSCVEKIADHTAEKELNDLEAEIEEHEKKCKKYIDEIEKNKKSILLVKKLSGIMGGAENLCGSTYSYKMLLLYEEYCNASQSAVKITIENDDNNNLTSVDDNTKIVQELDENVFYKQIVENKLDSQYLIGIGNYCEGKMLISNISKFDSLKYSAYLNLSKAYSCKSKAQDDLGRSSFFCAAIENFYAAVVMQDKEVNFYKNLCFDIIYKEIEFQIIPYKQLIELIHKFFELFPSANQNSFKMLLSCIKTGDLSLIKGAAKVIGLNLLDEKNHHVLDYLISQGFTDYTLIEILIENGAKINSPDSEKPLQFSALHSLINAESGPKIELLELLLKNINDVEKSSLLLTFCGNESLLKLISRQSDFKMQTNLLSYFLKAKTKYTQSFFLELTKLSDLNLFKFILAQSDDPKEFTLEFAILARAHKNILIYLINTSDGLKRNSDISYNLLYGSAHCDAEAFKLLLQKIKPPHDDLITYKNVDKNYTLFQHFVSYGTREHVEALIQYISVKKTKDQIARLFDLLFSQVTDAKENSVHLAIKFNKNPKELLETIFEHPLLKNNNLGSYFWCADVNSRTPISIARDYNTQIKSFVEKWALLYLYKEIVRILKLKFPECKQAKLSTFTKSKKNELISSFVGNVCARLHVLHDYENISGQNISHIILYSLNNPFIEIDKLIAFIYVKIKHEIGKGDNHLNLLIESYKTNSFISYDKIISTAFIDFKNEISKSEDVKNNSSLEIIKNLNSTIEYKNQRINMLAHFLFKTLELALNNDEKIKEIAEICLPIFKDAGNIISDPAHNLELPNLKTLHEKQISKPKFSSFFKPGSEKVIQLDPEIIRSLILKNTKFSSFQHADFFLKTNQILIVFTDIQIVNSFKKELNIMNIVYNKDVETFKQSECLATDNDKNDLHTFFQFTFSDKEYNTMMANEHAFNYLRIESERIHIQDSSTKNRLSNLNAN